MLLSVRPQSTFIEFSDIYMDSDGFLCSSIPVARLWNLDADFLSVNSRPFLLTCTAFLFFSSSRLTACLYAVNCSSRSCLCHQDIIIRISCIGSRKLLSFSPQGGFSMLLIWVRMPALTSLTLWLCPFSVFFLTDFSYMVTEDWCLLLLFLHSFISICVHSHKG